MSHRLRNLNNDAACEKYLNKILKHDVYTTKKSLAPKPYQDKISHVVKPTPMQSFCHKPKSNVKQTNFMQKTTTQLINSLPKDQSDNLRGTSKACKSSRQGSRSRSQSENNEREAWGQLLNTNKSKEKVSSFSNFDPLRTLHFLSKELHTKIETLMPNDEILQIVNDIHHALKRIPPEVSTLLHNPHVEYTPSEFTLVNTKSTLNRSCQTPPTLYQEDTEKFQKIMEENTYKLESSCKQLEMVCTSLQAEKEIAEKELAEAKSNIELLCRRIKDLENEMDVVTNAKIKQLEEEKQQLREELDKALLEANNNPVINHLKKLIDEVKKQKSASDEARAKLEYDMTLLKMEKEKYATMLAVRDREIKDIQDEMSKIQEEVTKQLVRLNNDVTKRSSTMKMHSEANNEGIENMFLNMGDTTISSITSNESDKEVVVREIPCGDSKIDNDSLEKVKSNKTDKHPPPTKDSDIAFQDLLKGLTPSVQALLTSHNL